MQQQQKTNVYLVGDKDAPKSNQWAAMTNSWAEASRLKEEMGPSATHKVVVVEPRNKQQRGGK